MSRPMCAHVALNKNTRPKTWGFQQPMRAGNKLTAAIGITIGMVGNAAGASAAVDATADRMAGHIRTCDCAAGGVAGEVITSIVLCAGRQGRTTA